MLAGAEIHAATYTNSTTTYNWIDPSAHTKVGYNTAPYKFNSCGTAPPTLDDTISDVIPIGWNFVYGVTSYNSLRIESNGRIQFNNANCGAGTASVGPPQTYTYTYPDANMNNTMKAFGVDLDPTNLVDKPNYPSAGSKTTCTSIATCYISYASIGAAPNRQFVVSWVNVPEWVTASNTSGSFTFQIILNEDGSFVYQYKTIVHGGTGKAQIGWQLTNADYTVLTFGAASEPGAPTAILFYVPSANPLAEYRFEEGAWSPSTAGQVQDSNGNLRPGSALGSTQTTSSGKVCRGASIASNTTAGAVDAIKTGVKFSDAGVNMTGQGTVMLWYKSAQAWVGSPAAQIIDAGSVSGQWFYLTKTATGTLFFEVTDSTGALRSVETSALAIAANTWTHIAISWNFNALPTAGSDHLQIFVNGGAATSATFTSAGTLSTALDYVHAGDNPSGFTGTKGTVNSANGTIDELRFYNSELIQAQVLSISALTRACNTYKIDHLELQPATWSGNACAAATMKVVACGDAACTAGNLYTGGLQATLSSTGVATLWDPASGGATITIGYGQSSATKSFNAASGITTLGVTGNGIPVVIPGATKCNGVAGSCQWTSANGGLVLTVPNSGIVTGGKPTAVTVQAVQATGATPGAACAPIQNLAATGLKLWSVPGNPSSFASTSTSASVTVGGAPQAANVQAGSYVYTPTAIPGSNTVTGLAFDNTATTTVWLKHVDTGQFTFNATLDAAATSTSPALTLTGNSTVTSVPVGFGVSANSVKAGNAVQTACAASPSAGCDAVAGPSTRLGGAGAGFGTTVTAALWTVDGDTDLTDNPVAPSYSGAVTLSPGLAGPVGGSTGALGITAITLAAGSNTTASQTWSQSGVLRISAAGTYFAQAITGQSAILGRFSPRNFNTVLTTQGCGTFTYSGQPITVVAVGAMDGSGTAVTPNYTGAYARQVTLSDANASALGLLSGNVVGAASFSAGVGNASPTYTFASYATVPLAIKLRAAEPVGADGIDSSVGSEATATIVSGRLVLPNAYGSEQLALPLTTRVEYYDTATSPGWRVATGSYVDTCTRLISGNFAFTTTASACTAPVASCITALSVTATGVGPFVSPWIVTLGKPTSSGNLCVSVNLDGTAAGKQCTATGAPGATATSVGAPWLRFPWTGATGNPVARANFGIYKSPLIYRRENY
ncbi:MAG: LamG domain-containing protein [Burkholderiales bacterium]|nr:LamG domain-containing protein [Burkholderiales bacterium]